MASIDISDSRLEDALRPVLLHMDNRLDDGETAAHIVEAHVLRTALATIYKELDDIEFDLVITVCDHASENCPIFKSKNSDKKTKVIHIGFEDPDNKPYSEFIKTYEQIKNELLPQIKNHLKIENKINNKEEI